MIQKALSIALLIAVGPAFVYAQTKEPENELAIAKLLDEKYGVGASVDRYGNIDWMEFSPVNLKKGGVKAFVEDLSDIKFLRGVVIKNCNIDREVLEELGQHPVLKFLHLTGCKFQEDDLEALKGFSTLTDLDLSSTPISDDALLYLKPLKNLKYLRLNDTKITGSGLRHLESLPLQVLFLSSTQISDDSLKSVGRIRSLQTLELHDTPVTGEGIKHLTELFLLIRLVTEVKVTEQFLEEHAVARAEAKERGLLPRRHRELRVVNFNDNRAAARVPQNGGGVDRPTGRQGIVQEKTDEPGNVRQLAQELFDEFGVNSFLDSDGQIVMADFTQVESENEDLRNVVAKLSKIKTLDGLKLSGTIDKEMLRILGTLPKLERLNLTGCELHDADLAALEDLTTLKELRLNHTPITDDALQYFKSLKNLELLYLDNTAVTGSGFKHLTSLPRLRNLYIAKTPITDDSLKVLSGLHSLRVLVLSQTSISDKGIESLTGLYQLVNLTVADTKVTEAGKEAFLKAHEKTQSEAAKKKLLPKNYRRLKIIR